LSSTIKNQPPLTSTLRQTMHLHHMKLPATTAAPLTAAAINHDQDEQGGSPQCCEDIMGQPLATQKNYNYQKSKRAMRTAEVWQQPPDANGNAATGIVMVTRMGTGKATAMAMAMAMATATVTATLMAKSMVSARVMAVAAVAAKAMAEG
jgi:hypothetical protein